MNDSVAVVIPTKNRRRLLSRTLCSVLRQRDVELSVIVVDDGSVDGTAEFIGCHRDPRVSLIRHETSTGVSRARNAGLARVTAPWVSFVDDDDVWSPHKLRHQLDALHNVDGAEWAVSAAAFIDASSRVLWIQHPLTGPLMPGLLRANVVPGGGSGVTAASAAVKAAGGFDPELSNLADWDMWIRLAQRGEPVTVMNPDIGYYLHERSMSLAVEVSRLEKAYLDDKYAALHATYAVPDDGPDWHRYLGDMYLRRGQPKAAIRELSRAGLRGTDGARVAGKLAVALLAPGAHHWARRHWHRRWRPMDEVVDAERWLQELSIMADLPAAHMDHRGVAPQVAPRPS